tara:strand:- start:126 stop:341 length:216 start_codon:yes stop_codon:yes gene_type:complete
VKKLRVTVEYTDGTPSKMGKDLDPEQVAAGIRSLLMKLCMTKSMAAIYITRADCLQFLSRDATSNLEVSLE